MTMSQYVPSRYTPPVQERPRAPAGQRLITILSPPAIIDISQS
jgi:hypothetical protein